MSELSLCYVMQVNFNHQVSRALALAAFGRRKPCSIASQFRVSLWRTKRHENAPLVSEGYEGEDWEPSNNVMLFWKSRALERKFLLQPSKQSILSLLPTSLGVISINAVRRLPPSPLLFLCRFQRDNSLKAYGSYICTSYCNVTKRCVLSFSENMYYIITCDWHNQHRLFCFAEYTDWSV
jgi:hypothetical protein